MSKEERKLKAKVDEYFEKYMCVSFDKFIENWEDLERYSKEQDEILQQKENIIKEVREYVKTKNYCSNIFTKAFAIFDKQELLEILDKGNNNEENKLKTNNEKVTIDDHYYYHLLGCENVLNELEKWLKESKSICASQDNPTGFRFIDMILNKIQDLKGSVNNEEKK